MCVVCVCVWGGGVGEGKGDVWVSVGVINMCVRVHAITKAFSIFQS